jgi:hypothetical protein
VAKLYASGPVSQLPADIIIQSGLTIDVMRLDEIHLNILRLLNDKWYENYVSGLSFHDLVTQLGVDQAKRLTP